MRDLKTVSALVKQILEKNVEARNSDNILYLEVLRYYSSEKALTCIIFQYRIFDETGTERISCV